MKMEIDKAKEILSRTPVALNELLQNLSDEWVLNNEGGESWSPYDITGHLINADQTNWIPRIQTILDHGESHPFGPFNRFAHLKNSKGKSLSDLLQTFAIVREISLKVLQDLNITPEKLSLKGKHPDFGTVTLSQLISCWVVHDLNHISQIVRVMAGQYRDEVGPWIAYLPILNPKKA